MEAMRQTAEELNGIGCGLKRLVSTFASPCGAIASCLGGLRVIALGFLVLVRQLAAVSAA
jgi:hypothetical protein